MITMDVQRLLAASQACAPASLRECLPSQSCLCPGARGPACCRGWTIVWGALSLLMTLIPSFRDFRLLNVIALAGTAFTAIYICASAGVHGFTRNAVNLAPYSFQTFFTGANVFLWAYGGHGVSFEVRHQHLSCLDKLLLACASCLGIWLAVLASKGWLV